MGPSDRRTFLRRIPLAAGAAAALAGAVTSSCTSIRTSSGSGTPGSEAGEEPVRFGLVTDIHQDIMHDGVERVSAFVAAMTRDRVEFVAQLGDFCCPYERNRTFLEAWNRFPGPRYHVLGNHDMDGGFRREQTVAFYGMPARYYAFVHRGLRILVLDGNDPGGSAGGYRRFVAADQLDWLASELAAGSEPILVFVHQALDHPQGVENQVQVRAMLESARWPDGSPRVVAVFCGHHHQDWTRTLNGIHYLQLNSASYQWVGESFAHDSYAPEILAAHPWIRSTCPYRDPLWARVTLDPRRGVLEVEGRTTVWVGPSPWDLRITPESMSPETTLPAVRSRRREVRPIGRAA